MTTTIDVQIIAQDQPIPTTEQMTLWASQVFDSRRSETEITIRIVDEAEIQQLNASYRNKNQPTNVLSFGFELPPGVPAQEIDFVGDLVICSAVVSQQATAQNKPLMAHWAHMIIHGCLHLLGYDHINSEDAVEMEAIEITVMQTLGYENPYGDDEL